MDIIGPDIRKAIKAIEAGKVLVCPTDTVYGMVCDATNKKALNKLYKVKKRPLNKPVPIFVDSIKTARKLAKISPQQEKHLKSVWPGKVTTVLKKKRGRGTIGLRIPKYLFLRRLLRRANCPLTGTSANISGGPVSTNIKEVIKQFKGRKYQPDLFIDAGDLPKNKPSKVIDLTIWPPKTLRF